MHAGREKKKNGNRVNLNDYLVYLSERFFFLWVNVLLFP